MAHVDRVGKTSASPGVRLSSAREFEMSQSTGRSIGHLLTYAVLIAGALVMIFPLFWMFTSSFKPSWQIFTQPPIWIPSEWIEVRAGNTAQSIPTWYASPAGGQRQEVIKIGTRRYTTAVD